MFKYSADIFYPMLLPPLSLSLFKPQAATMHDHHAATPTSTKYSPHQKSNCPNLYSDLKLQNLLLLNSVDILSLFRPQAAEPPSTRHWQQQRYRNFVNKISIKLCANKNDAIVLRGRIHRRGTTTKWDKCLEENGPRKYETSHRNKWSEIR